MQMKAPNQQQSLIENQRFDMQQMPQGNVNIPSQITRQAKEIDILLKLLPYFEVPMNVKSSEGQESKTLRKLLGIAKSEADMIQR